MEEFLEEVKRKIKYEVQEKYRSNERKRGSRNDTLFSERSADPKQIAHEIAKRIRESVTRDVGKKLARFESIESHRSDFRRDTRRILEERLKHVLENEIDLEDETSAPTRNKGRAKSLRDFSNIGCSISRHKRDVELSDSSRNLLRSFSAPVPGSAFGKLLLEDQHILTGVHIRRKHELSEKTSREVKKSRRENLNLRGRVLNLKENFKLFGKKPNSSKNPAVSNRNSPKDNATEVPPSPASISSSSHDEPRTPDNPSPVSPLEVQLTDSQPSQSFVEDLNFDFPELNDQLEQVENEEPEESTTKEETETETENLYEMFEVKSDDEAYIRDILIAAGFYEDRYSNYKSPRSEAPTSSIQYRVFEEVEEAYNRLAKIENEDSLVDHKMLFDLVNEALQSVIDNPRNCNSTLRRWILERAHAPRGKELLSDLWCQIRTFRDLPMHEMQTMGGVTARDAKLAPRSRKFYDNIDSSGKKIEFAILGELIDEFVQEMWLDGAANELHSL
uniref:DUF4378 domain-containing protein n=1 Tax=Ananas comosus var. bracteatus TaxID=296719 RepID=A0A6V7PIE5_ANACO|nr:unnamed protein product [Ananas comosus var. bracteatus]